MSGPFRKNHRVVIQGIVSRPELNGRPGVVEKEGEERCAVRTALDGETISIKCSNLKLFCDHSAVIIHALAASKTLGQFVDDVTAGTVEQEGYHHNHASDLQIWASDADIAAVLADGPKLEALVTAMSESVSLTAMNCSQQLKPHFALRGKIQVLRCIGCNTCYDGGLCTHEEAPPRMRLPSGGGFDTLADQAHSAMLRVELVTGLLRSCSMPDEEKLLDLLVVEAPAGAGDDWFLQQMSVSRSFAPCALLAAIDSCTAILPKCAHLAVSLLSLLVSRRPAAMMAQMDAEPWAAALYRYLQPVFDRIKVIPCKVEEVYGVSQLIAVIPLLYHLSDWARAKEILARHDLPMVMASFAVHMVWLVGDGQVEDRPLDEATFPELAAARCSIARVFGGGAGARLLQDRPVTFAFAAVIELLGRWQYRGVDVSRLRCSCTPPEDIAPTLTARQRANYTETVGAMVTECMPKLDSIIARTPEIAFTKPIAEALARGVRPSLPRQDANLLRGPLHAHMTCGMPGCMRTTTVGGGALKQCNGGCSGLVRYCCTEHQRAHWPQHKRFCKNQQRVVDDPAYAAMIAEFGGMMSARQTREALARASH